MIANDRPSHASTDAQQLVRALAEARARWVAFVAKRVPAEIDPEDVVQRALARATRFAENLREPGKLVPWFYRVLRREIADALADHAAEPVRVEADEALVDAVASDAPAANLSCGCVTKLMNDLRPEYAAVLQRVVLDEASVRDAARELEISENNAAVRLHRARGALRRELQSCCGVASLRACLDCSCDTHTRCGDAASA